MLNFLLKEKKKAAKPKETGSVPDGVVHPGDGQVGGQVGRVGRADDEREEPPAAHDDPQGHGAQDGVAACGDG